MQIKYLMGGVLGISLAAAMVLGIVALTGVAREPDNKSRLQELSGMEASDFKFQWENYPPPNEAQVKTLLEGDKAQAQSAGLILLTEARLKTFSTNGTLEVLAQSPKCTLDSVQKTVSSTGALQIQTMDGRFLIEGEGFLLQSTNSHLIISNRVHTVLRSEPGKTLIQ
jgi:hypothetical protein